MSFIIGQVDMDPIPISMCIIMLFSVFIFLPSADYENAGV
jgi:hypothetical protein